MFDILSWNIRQGGGTRISKILSSIEKQNPNVVALSEFRNNHSGLKIRYALLKLGYRYQVASHAETSENSAFLASKHPCSSIIFPKCDPKFDHNIVCGRYPAFDIYSVYFPHKKKHQLFEFLIDEQLEKDRTAIITGDFNTGKNFIDQAGDSFWYTSEIERLEYIGYNDAFRYIHGNTREFSWYSHQGNGYRYDHTYVSEELLPIISECNYLQEWRMNGLSDHAPMLLSLKV